MKRITKSTIKSFVNKHRENLYIKNVLDFDTMLDGRSIWNKLNWRKAKARNEHLAHTLGVCGIWLVGGSRNYYKAFEDETYKGYEVYNSCCKFFIAVKKEVA